MGLHDPELLSEAESLFVPKMGGEGFTHPSLFGHRVGPGDRVTAIDGGERLIHATVGTVEYGHVWYSLTVPPSGKEYLRGRFFLQTKPGFIGDIGVGGVAGGVIKRTTGTKEVIKNFLDVYLGALACAGGPLAWAITGMNVLVTTGNVIRDYRTYEDALVAVLASRKELKEHLPTLYDEVFYTLLIGTIEQKLKAKGKEALADAVKGPKLAGKLVGVLLGAVGEDLMKQRFAAVKELCTEVFAKVAQHSMDKGGKLGSVAISEDQVRQLAQHHVLRIFNKTSLAPMGLSTAEEIVREVSGRWNVRSTYVKVAAALEKMG